MSKPVPYLLDTNVVLFATRQGSAQAQAIDQQFGLRNSPFRPVLCEVTVAELLAFAQGWGEKRRKLLMEVIEEHVVLPIGRREIHEEWARLKSHAKSKGLAIQHDHNDIWIAATARVARPQRHMDRRDGACSRLDCHVHRSRGMLALELLDPRTGVHIP